MGEDQQGPWRRPFQWLFHSCLLLLGSVIALNIAVTYLRPVLPWLIGGAALVAVGWVAVAVERWRRLR